MKGRREGKSEDRKEGAKEGRKIRMALLLHVCLGVEMTEREDVGPSYTCGICAEKIPQSQHFTPVQPLSYP